MTFPRVRFAWPLIAFASLVSGLVLMVSASGPGAGPIVTITPAQQARLARKAAAMSARRFDEPDRATEFYVVRC